MTIGPLQLLFRTLFVGLVIWLAVDWALDQYETVVRERDELQTALDLQVAAASLAAQQLAARDSIDTQRTEALTRALNENNRLQRAVADRNQRLLVHATCPVVPGTAGTAGLADGSAAELTADARSAYFTLRDELARSREMILGLQDYIRQVVQATPAQP